jgi:hypothetical protein
MEIGIRDLAFLKYFRSFAIDMAPRRWTEKGDKPKINGGFHLCCTAAIFAFAPKRHARAVRSKILLAETSGVHVFVKSQ